VEMEISGNIVTLYFEETCVSKCSYGS